MRRLFIAVVLGLLILVVPATVHADVNNFTITSFTADETLTRRDPQGELHIVEKIYVTFTDFNHGIYRAIPNEYKSHPLKVQLNSVSSETGAPAQYTRSTQHGNLVLKIGSPDSTVTGNQEYTIDYTLHNVIDFQKGFDELYWDVNGDQWPQPATSVTMYLHLPSDLRLSAMQPLCFPKAEGTVGASDCTITKQGQQIVATATNLPGYKTLTYAVGFESGYFKPASWLDTVRDYAWQLVLAIGIPLLVGFGCLTWWLRSGRDAKGRGTIVPQYAPPAGISPLQAGSIVDFVVDNRDITATIIDLARRGYMQIVEERKDRLILKDKLSYTLKLLDDDLSKLDGYERSLLNALFSNLSKGQEVKLADLKTKLATTAQKLRKDVSKGLLLEGYFRNNPSTYMLPIGSIVTILYVAVFFVGPLGATHMISVGIGLVVSVLIFAVTYRHIPARTAKGVEAREYLLGLKMYMETAEKDRMKMLEAPGAAYASGAGEPVRTVELFERLLPYAIAMQVEKAWAGQFKDIYKTPPDWYSGNVTAFNAGYLAGSLNSGFASAVNASFSAPSSSSSSGFGGGGFSGGGGGGGGGGGW